MRRTDRLFELIQLLGDGRLWRARDLAARVEVCLRTIYRDIESLVASGIPIEGERGVGYVLRDPVFLPPLTLTASELLALHFGMAVVGRAGDPALAEAAERLKRKVDAVLPRDRRGFDHLAGIAVHSPAPAGAYALLPVVRDAIRARRVLAVEYERLDDVTTVRCIRPLHLEFWGRVWTCTAWCELRDDFRVFRVDRLTCCTDAGRAFRDEPGRTYGDFLAHMAARQT